MATLTSTLTLVSTDATTDALSLTASSALTVGPPQVGISKVAAEASGGSDTAIKPSATANQYLYIKHTGKQGDGSTATTSALVVKAGSTTILVVGADEFAFLPVKNDVVINIVSSSAHTILTEYAYWSAA